MTNTRMNFSGFYLITDSKLTKQGVVRDIEDAISGGATIVQYREKERDTGPMIDEAQKIKNVCKGKALFLINDRVDVCLAVDAGGVHLGQSDMSYTTARRLLGDGKIIGVTVHNLEEAREAEAQGADYVGVSPIFKTTTKSDAGPAAGLELIKQVRKEISIPIVAISGITLQNAKSVIDAGANTVCAISATVGTESVAGSVKRFNEIIKSTSAV